MKNRNRANRRRGWNTRSALPSLFAKRDPRKRKEFKFEQLEQRLAFSVSPLNYETNSISNDTAAGAAAILMRELQWAALQSASMSGALDLASLSLPTDPYFPDPNNPGQPGQWHLLNVGQPVGNPDFQFIYGTPGEDINVVPAWNLGYTGAGIIVAVLDDGVQISHPDLAGNIDPLLGFNAFTGANNANPSFLSDFHGTAVSGLIGATWSNEEGMPATGGVGVAPEVTLVPIKMLGGGGSYNGQDPVLNAFRYALMVGADITNNSWGPATDLRVMNGMTPAEIQLLRDTVMLGRDGLGMIHVFASGNNGGPGGFPLDFQNFGNWDSAAYNGYINSRYTIGVSGIDHDGLYANADGTITAYPEGGPSVLVAAPTGSNVAQNVADDSGQGSGLWTTDLVGDFGYNALKDPFTGIDDDRDFVDDANYTSRFNGTSAAAPLVSGVIALMLDANPNLTYRDVQEILVRSSRQAAQFEFPSNGAGESASFNTWQTNPMIPFRDPDAWDVGVNAFDALFDPIADPTLTSFPYSSGFGFGSFPDEGNDFQRQFGHYELQPAEFANGAGYTVSQGYGVYGELIGYAHGVVDAEMAVIMARDWHTLNQDIPPKTEKTFSTFINPQGAPPYVLPPGERGSDDIGNLLVPGGIQRSLPPDTGFISFWEEYVADPPDPFNPADPDSWPDNTRGASYIDFKVPLNQQINVEWVEIKLSITGPAADLDYLKINLTSPNGMQSELNNYSLDPDFFGPGSSLQFGSEPADGWSIDTPGDLSGTWTFSTNRNWGESTNSAVIVDPLTGEPVAGPGSFDFTTGNFIPEPIYRDWELHLENWSNSQFEIQALEIVWHGKPIAGGQLDQDWLEFDSNWKIPVAQRIQGVIGIDTNGDDEFSGIDDDPTFNHEWNNRFIQEFFGFDPTEIRQTELQRRLLDDFEDNNNNGIFDDGDVRRQEPFAANILVEAFEFSVVNGVDIVNPQPIAQFLTGADGNYYFDLVPGNYVIRATDRNPVPGTLIDDPNAPADRLQHFKDEWRITEDWFYAPDRDAPFDTNNDGLGDIPGEILYDSVAQAPVAFQFDAAQPRIPMAVQNINFLYKPQVTPTQNIVVNGTVWADVNVNGAVDIFDAPAGSMRVYVDSIRNGQFDPGEQFVYSASNGTYSLTVNASSPAVIAIGVDFPAGWVPSIAGGNVISLLAEPGSVLNGKDFFLNPPDDPNGSGLGNITGYVFNDIDGDGLRDGGEGGVENITVYIDTANFGILDPGELSVSTGPNGGYFLPNLAAGSYRIDVVTTPAQQLTAPAAGFRTVSLAVGETEVGVVFGVQNLAYRDFGDLPASFNANGFPNHVVAQHFRLGETITGEVGASSAADDPSDDGVEVISNGGVIQPGDNRILVQTFGAGGRLTGWIDWSGDGQFQSEERVIFIDPATGAVLGNEADLSPNAIGTELRFDLPAAPNVSVGARFRWGEVGLGLSSTSFIGEVEDYVWTSSSSVVAPSLPGDFNQDNSVDAADYVMFRKFAGAGASPQSGTTPFSLVVPDDQTVWESNFGTTHAVAPPSLEGDFNDDGIVDTADYVAYRKFVGTNSPLPNSTNPGGPVDDDDHTLWISNYGNSGGGGSGAAVNQPTAPSNSTPSEPAFSLSMLAGYSNTSLPSSSDNTESSPIFVGAIVDVSAAVSFASTKAEFQSASPASDEQSAADALLLLDQAMAELDDNDDAPLADRKSDDDGYDDLALAAVFDDDSSWWSL